MNRTMILTLLMLLCSSASAESLPAWAAGKASFPNEEGCFQWTSLGDAGAWAVGNYHCDGVKRWSIPLTLRFTGVYTVSVRVLNAGAVQGSPGATTARCFTSTTNDAGAFVQGGTTASSSIGGYQTLTLRTASVPAGGTVVVTCELSRAGSRVLSVNW